MRFLFLLFVILPILEIWVLLKVGSLIGVLSTVALVLLTAVLGVALLRQQGLATVLRARARMQQGEAPAREVIEGIVLAIGGVLLLTPGFITDTIGFCCLLPGVRGALVGWGLKRAVVVQAGPGAGAGRPGRDSPPQRDAHTIEGEFRREDEPPDTPPK